MKKLMKKIMLMSLAMLMVSTLSVYATGVVCQQKEQTGCGYYQANCSDKYLKCHGYYSSNSERYTVMNYIGISGNVYKYAAGCHAGKRNAYINQVIPKGYSSFKDYMHKHSFTKNLN